MSLTRQLKRKGLNKYRHCGKKMIHKQGYDTSTHEYWFCEVCGYKKWFEKNKVEE